MKAIEALDIVYRKCPKLVEAYNEFMSSATKDARALAMQFERKKAAFVTAKATNHKSGALDMNMLAQYKTADDLFARQKVNPQGKNHSFYVLLDWSGSMSTLAVESLKQTFIQAIFLRKQRIDHKVMLFLSRGYGARRDLVTNDVQRPVGTVYDHGTELVVFFDSNMSAIEFAAATKMMFLIGGHCGNHMSQLMREGIDEYSRTFNHWNAHKLQAEREAGDIVRKMLDHHGMGSTPLNISLLEIYNMMRREHAVKPDVSQNLVVITDGESGGLVINGRADDHGWNRDNMLAAAGTYFTAIDGRTHNVPQVLFDAVERGMIYEGTAETYGVFSLFDWKVNRTMIYLGESRGILSDTNRLLGYKDINGQTADWLEGPASELKDGKILEVSNVYGCVDDMFIVPIKTRRRDDVDLWDDEMDEKMLGRNGEIDVKKFAKMAAKQALKNPLEHLAFAIGDAVAKNYALNKNVHTAKSDARVTRAVWKDTGGRVATK